MPLLYSSTNFFSTGIVVQRGLCGGGVGGVEDVQEFPRMDTLPSGSLHQRRDDAVGFESAVRSGAEGHLGPLGDIL